MVLRNTSRHTGKARNNETTRKIVITRSASSPIVPTLYEGTMYVVNITEKPAPFGFGYWMGRWVIKPYTKYMLIINAGDGHSIYFAVNGKATIVKLDSGAYIINYTLIMKPEVKQYFEIKHLDTGYEARFTIYPERCRLKYVEHVEEVGGRRMVWKEVIPCLALGEKVNEIDDYLCEITHEPKLMIKRECVCHECVNGSWTSSGCTGTLVCCKYREYRVRPVIVFIDSYYDSGYFIEPEGVWRGDWLIIKLVKVQEYVVPS